MKYLKHILSTLVLVAFFAFSGFSQCEINIGEVDVNKPEAFEFTASSSSICGVNYTLSGATSKRIAFVVIALDTANKGRDYKMTAYRTSDAASNNNRAVGDATALVQGRRYKIIPQLLVE